MAEKVCDDDVNLEDNATNETVCDEDGMEEVDVPEADVSEEDCTTDDEDSYDSSIYDPSFDESMDIALETDLKRFYELYPEDSEERLHSYRLGFEMALDFLIPTLALEKATVQAWRLNEKEPLTVSLVLDSTLYLNAKRFRDVSVYQKSTQSNTCGLRQLNNIAKSFCETSLRELSNKKVMEAHGNRDKKNPTEAALAEMGFPQDLVTKALERAQGSQRMALELLLDGFDSQNVSAATDESAEKVLPNLIYTKHTPSLENGFLVQFYQYMEQRLSTLNQFCMNCDKPLIQSLKSLMEFGLSMDTMWNIELKVCERLLCIFTSRLFVPVVRYTRLHMKAVDLLIVFTKAAILSSRQHLILTPYPAISNDSYIVINEGQRNSELLSEVVRRIPSSQDLLAVDEDELKKKLVQHHELCHPLVEWIIRSNNAIIWPLSSQMRCAAMETGHQFLVDILPAVREQFEEKRKIHGSTFAFHSSPIENWHSIVRQGLIVASGTDKQLHGAAHGSGIYLSPYAHCSMPYARHVHGGKESSSKASNDHNMPLQDTGFICGRIGPDCFEAGTITCIALCEVIESVALEKNHNIWVCRDSDHVSIRFLFVFDELHRMSPKCNIVSNGSQMKEWIARTTQGLSRYS